MAQANTVFECANEYIKLKIFYLVMMLRTNVTHCVFDHPIQTPELYECLQPENVIQLSDWCF